MKNKEENAKTIIYIFKYEKGQKGEERDMN